jgi:ADP-ribose pyrophosphatase YjhB (NUDIX family)
MNMLQAFLFCPRCGAKFTDKEKGCLCCNACGSKFFDSPKPCAGVIPINEKGEVLLTERAVDPHKGKLDILGGFLQSGETFEEGVRREATEELGLKKLEDLKYLTSYSHGYKYQDIEYALATVIFTARIEGSVALNVADDVASYKFVSPKDVTVGMLAFPGLKAILDSL